MEVHTAILFLSLISLHQITSVTASRCRNIQNGLLGSLCSICNDDVYMDHFCAGLTDKSGLITISISSINGTRCCTGSDCRIGIDLRNCTNLLANDRANSKRNAFDFVITDSNKECFGGDSSWSRIAETNDVKICSDELNLCQNETCPENSHCVENKTNVECHCDSGWHGYKCLRYGRFAAINWLLSIGASTFVIMTITKIFQIRSYRTRRRSKNFGTQ